MNCDEVGEGEIDYVSEGVHTRGFDHGLNFTV